MIKNSNVALLWEELKQQGRRSVRSTRRQWRECLGAYPTARPLSVAVALALVWSKHAKDTDEFFDSAVAFVNRGRAGLQAAVRQSHRFPPEALERASALGDCSSALLVNTHRLRESMGFTLRRSTSSRVQENFTAMAHYQGLVHGCFVGHSKSCFAAKHAGSNIRWSQM
jgi:hypothetical protein